MIQQWKGQIIPSQLWKKAPASVEEKHYLRSLNIYCKMMNKDLMNSFYIPNEVI